MTVVAFRHRGSADVEGVTPAAGVALHLDYDAGDFWLDVSLDHDAEALEAMVASLHIFGLEMDESDTDDMNADGMLRIYLLEVEPHEHDDNQPPVLRLA